MPKEVYNQINVPSSLTHKIRLMEHDKPLNRRNYIFSKILLLMILLEAQKVDKSK